MLVMLISGGYILDGGVEGDFSLKALKKQEKCQMLIMLILILIKMCSKQRKYLSC